MSVVRGAVPPSELSGVMMIDFGVIAYALLNVITTEQLPDGVPPARIVKVPAASVDPVVTVSVGEGELPQFVALPMVGAVVWVDSKWLFVIMNVANVPVVPETVILRPVVSAVKRLAVAAEFWI